MMHTVSLTYPASPATVSAMLADPAYQRSRLGSLADRAQMSVEASARPDGLTSGFDTHISGEVPASSLPSIAQRFLSGSVGCDLREHWEESDEHGQRQGRWEIATTGIPVTASATALMRPATVEQAPQAMGTVVEVQVDLTLNLPFLVRGAVESQIPTILARVVAREESLAASWLASRSAT